MNRRMFLTYLKVKVILFTLFVLGVPTTISVYVDLIGSRLILRTDPLDGLCTLLHYPWYAIFIFLIFQYVIFCFLGSLWFNIGKVLLKKENRDFFLM